MTTRTRSAAWMAIGLLVGTLGTSTWLQAQGSEARRDAVELALRNAMEQAQPDPGRAPGTKVYTAGDIGFRTAGTRGGVPLVVPVVRVNGEWVEVAFGGGGITKLTQ